MKILFDTNILIEYPEIVDIFPPECLVFPTFLIEEIEKKKHEGFGNLKHVIKFIETNAGISTLVDIQYPQYTYVDDKIIQLLRCKKYSDLQLITNDRLLKIRCLALKIPVHEFKFPQTQRDYTHLYKKTFSDEQVQQLNENNVTVIDDRVNYNSFTYDATNEIMVYNNIKNRTYDLITLASRGDKAGAINLEQAACMRLLMDEDIPAVFLRGKAGSGKTCIAVIAALQLLDYKSTKRSKTDKKESIYKQISICRPNVSLGKEIGFLPGMQDEKLMPFMNPIKDAFKLVFKDNPTAFEDMIDQRLLEIIPMAFLRGRSLNNQILILDEAQNCNYHELKSVLTRVGKNAKVILTGDCDQKDIKNSGLSTIINSLVNEKLIGQYVLEKCERSELADLCVRKLSKEKED